MNYKVETPSSQYMKLTCLLTYWKWIWIFFHVFFLIISITIDFSSFPYHLKLVNTAPVHKKDSQNDKKNYRLVSLLSNISKVFENILKEWSRQYQLLSIWKFEVLAGLPSNISSSNATKSLQQRQPISLVSAWHFPHWHYPMFPAQFCRDSGWLFFPFLSGMWPHWKLLAWFCFSDSN